MAHDRCFAIIAAVHPALGITAIVARKEVEVARILCAIGVFFRRSSAAVALPYYLSLTAKIHGHALIKCIERPLKILSWKFFHVRVNPAIELSDFFESFVL